MYGLNYINEIHVIMKLETSYDTLVWETSAKTSFKTSTNINKEIKKLPMKEMYGISLLFPQGPSHLRPYH